MATAVKQVEVGDLPLDPEEAAEAAGLRYVNDGESGIRRKRSGKGFTYAGADGATIKDEPTLQRIRSLAIPPAWSDVWICRSSRGHIQATGRDARGRKQYRYHPKWREVRDEAKYSRLVQFGESLPTIRERVEQDLSLRGLPREKVVATVVRLLDTTLIRVGNPEYAKANDSYGLTTLRDKHVDVEGSKLRFRFKGKSGKLHSVSLTDRRLATIVKRCQEIPGHELFQYLDDDEEPHSIESDDINRYLHEISGEEFTAKDFRTWGGTVLAAEALKEQGEFESEREAKSNVVGAIKQVAEQLRNTPAVCRKCYVHPAIIESYMDGTLTATWQQAERSIKKWIEGLRREEAILLVLLKDQQAKAA